MSVSAAQSSSSFNGFVRKCLISLFTVNVTGFLSMAAFLFVAEIVIVYHVIQRIPYTEIDWSTYMQQVKHFVGGERNYSLIRGDTGPVVYPAGFLHIYRIFYSLTDHGTDIRSAQYIFGGLYLATLLLVFRLFYLSRRIPPFVLPLICLTSYRIHSIFLLRLFNDPVAMFFFYFAVNLFVSRHWLFGCVIYSLAVGVKMNILLFAPALFFILLLSNGPLETVWLLAVMALIQIVIALDFLAFDPFAYLSGAFELSRVFLFKWTVNWRFLPEWLFLDRRFHIFLLIAHICLLIFFARKFWLWAQGGLPMLMRKLMYGVHTRLGVHDILFALFTSNLIGISFARSLHYQFFCWYYHSVPYLLFSSQSVWSLGAIIIRVALMLGVEFCWNVYPSTPISSLLLHCLHFSILFLACRAISPNTHSKKPI